MDLIDLVGFAVKNGNVKVHFQRKPEKAHFRELWQSAALITYITKRFISCLTVSPTTKRTRQKNRKNWVSHEIFEQTTFTWHNQDWSILNVVGKHEWSLEAIKKDSNSQYYEFKAHRLKFRRNQQKKICRRL